MATHFVYSPYSGLMTSCITQRRYCSDACAQQANEHPSPLGDYPIDVIGGAGPLAFYGSPTIKSINLVRRYNIYCGSGQPEVRNAQEIRLYTGYDATGVFLGRVYFGHVWFTQPEGTHNLSIISTAYGQRSYKANVCTVPDAPWYAHCYEGDHVHIETLPYIGGNPVTYVCNSSYVAGANGLYSYYS